jgi:hypothetical protein
MRVSLCAIVERQIGHVHAAAKGSLAVDDAQFLMMARHVQNVARVCAQREAFCTSIRLDR